MNETTTGVSANDLAFLAAVRALANASRFRDENKRLSESHFTESMELSAEIDDPKLVDDFYEIYSSVRCQCAYLDTYRQAEISGIQVRFKEQLSTLIPGAVLCDQPKVKTQKKPDAWILLDGEVIPVEVKRGAFGNMALAQLLGYMQIFGAKKGIAVAPTLTCSLPDGIVFVAVE